MTAKEYLNQAFHLDQRINSKLDMLAMLKEMATKTTSIMQDDVVSHTRNVHSMEDAIAKMVDMQTEINADIDQLVDKKQEIIHAIYAVENPEFQTLLELRYICVTSHKMVKCEVLSYEVDIFGGAPVRCGINKIYCPSA